MANPKPPELMECDTPGFRVRTRSEADGVYTRAAKRLASSPPQECDLFEMGPPPLSDAELRKLTESLAALDVNFAKINAVSKESAIKKKELEQIIAAYRSAIDKLATAYTRISAEWDTTARIWRMMRLGPRSGNGAWMDREAVAAVSQQIREDVCAGVGRVVDRWRDGAIGPIAQQRSYVAVTQLGPSRLLPEERGDRENLETIVVVPGRSIEDKVRDTSATCDAVTGAIKPDELGIRVDRIIKGRNKVVRIMAERNELNKIKPALESVGLEVGVSRLDT